MFKSVRIRQVHQNTLSCEPILRKAPNGELLCIAQTDGTCEPHKDNRVFAFHSKDNGETWSEWYEKIKVFPEDGRAVYCTAVSVLGDEITAQLTVHNGNFLDNCETAVVKSFDSGYTWEHCGHAPHFSGYTHIRADITTEDGRIITPYQHYEFSDATNANIKEYLKNGKELKLTANDFCETGVLISDDNGKTYERHLVSKFDLDGGWVFSEPTLAKLSDGRIAMLRRKDRTGVLWYNESADGGKTWSETIKTDIPNPGCKPKLLNLENNLIALIHTPSPKERNPIAIWISDDDMKTWKYKKNLVEFPGMFCYSDGFYENGHIMFTIEHNRHTILFFDVELEI